MYTGNKTKAQMLSDEQNVQKARRERGRSTIRIWYTDGREVLKYHETHVVTKYPDGKIELNTGGYRTLTTKERINGNLPGRLFIAQVKGVWYLCDRGENWEYPGTELSEFYDGITIDGTGKLITEKYLSDRRARDKTLRAISKYANGITAEDIKLPSNGDCWYCLLRTQEGKTLGDWSAEHGSDAHLTSHMEERYYPGALIYNALEERGYANPAFHIQCKILWSIKKALRVYLKKRLLPELAYP